MNKSLVQFLHTRYHPSKAVKTEEQGIFNVHTFRDGTQLRVRRMFERKLFYPKWWRIKKLTRKPLWKYNRPLSTNTEGYSVSIHSAEKLEIVIREMPYDKRKKDINTLQLIAGILKNRIRIESPLFELKTPDYQLIGTRFVEGEELADAIEKLTKRQRTKMIGQVAQIMAKLHINGLYHGHMHGGNIIVRNNKLVLVDPKYLGKLPNTPTPEEVEQIAQYSLKPLHPIAFIYNPPRHIETDLRIAIKDLTQSKQELFTSEYTRHYRREYERKSRRPTHTV